MKDSWQSEMKKELEELEIPNVYPQVMEKYDEREYVRKNKTKKNLFLKWGCSFACLLLVGGIIYSASKKNGFDHKHTSDHPTILKTNKAVFAFESYSSLSFVSNEKVLQQMRRKASLTAENKDMIQKDIVKVLPLLESTMLIENGISIQPSNQQKEGYTYCDEVTITMNENQETYYLYYNKVEKQEIKKDETKVETYYQGEMVFDTVTYSFEMEGGIEEEDNEIEKESTFTLYLDDSKENAIVTSKEIENQEEEFTYTLIENGEDIFEASIEIEEKNGKIITKIEFENKMFEEEIEHEYLFFKEQDENGEYYLLKSIQTENGNYVVRVYKQDGTYKVVFYDENNEHPLA